MPFPILRTARLILRQLRSSDANEILALRSNPDVNQYLDRSPSKSIEDAQSFIRVITENDALYWAITLNNAHKLIGTICLFNFSSDNLTGEIGYELLPEFQGQGIMREAASKVVDYGAQHIGLHAIEAYTHAENQSSIKLLKQLHFDIKNAAEGNEILFCLTINGNYL